MLLPYKSARLVYPKDKDTKKNWYVIYYYLVPGTTDQWQRFRETFNMNRRYKDPGDRYTFGKRVEKFINGLLDKGYNPFERAAETAAKKAAAQKLTIVEQLKKIIDELKEGATKSVTNTLTEQQNRLVKYINEKGLTEGHMHNFSGDDAKDYRKYVDKDLKCAPKTINQAVTYGKRFWTYAIEEKNWCSENPFNGIKPMRKNAKKKNKRQIRFEPLTSVEVETIFNYLAANRERDYMRFIAMILYQWVRPVEISRIKVGDIDLKNGLIHFASDDTKNQEKGMVQIVEPMRVLLEEMKLHTYAPNLYLFSGDGKGYKPGLHQLDRRRSSDKWLAIVKGILKIQKDQYGLKHTGNIDYLLKHKEKADLTWQQHQNRHKTRTETENYCRDLNAYFVDVKALKFTTYWAA